MEPAIHDVEMIAGSSPSPNCSGRNLPHDDEQNNLAGQDESKPTSERLMDETDHFAPLKEILFPTNDWLLKRNDDLHRIVLSQGKRSQADAIAFNNLWQKFTAIAQSKDALEWSRQGLVSENISLKNELAQARHALGVERYQNSEIRKSLELKDQLVASSGYQAASHRELSKLTREQLTLITTALLKIVGASGSSKETAAVIQEVYENQLKENEDLRQELGVLLQRLDESSETTQRPALNSKGQSSQLPSSKLSAYPPGSSLVSGSRRPQQPTQQNQGMVPNPTLSTAPLQTQGFYVYQINPPPNSQENTVEWQVEKGKGKVRG